MANSRSARWAGLVLGALAVSCATPPELEEAVDPTNADGGAMQAPSEPIGVGDPSGPDGVGWSTRFPKLSNAQWDNTVRDLFYPSEVTGFAKDFTQEPLDRQYSSVAAANLTVGQAAWLRYQAAAEQVAELASRDRSVLAALLGPSAEGDLEAQAASFIERFGLRAYRRPLTAAERATYARLFAKAPELVSGPPLEASVRLVIETMLQSPHFLYRVESAREAPDSEPRKAWLSGYEVATRLSYALWDSMPSDELFAAAGAGELDTAEGVARWAESMLADPKAEPVLTSFHEQTFDVAAYGTQDKEPALGFDAAALGPVLKEEANLFFREVIVKGDLGIKAILTSTAVFVNEQTAPFYGLKDVVGPALQKRTLAATERAGLLTQLGFLTKNATRSSSDPVHRGLLVLRKVLCDEPDPPPMTFMLPSAQPGLTTRQVYERATACGVGCHDTLINPPGFAFEVFDAVGRVRAFEEGQPIDAAAALSIRNGFTPEEKRAGPTSTIAFDGPVELLTKLAAEPRVHECYARNWMNYALARELHPVERGASAWLRDRSVAGGSVRELLAELVQLDTFRARVSE